MQDYQIVYTYDKTENDLYWDSFNKWLGRGIGAGSLVFTATGATLSAPISIGAGIVLGVGGLILNELTNETLISIGPTVADGEQYITKEYLRTESYVKLE